MFCPECEAEYREGFTWCADCDGGLVGSLAPGARTVYEAQQDVSRDNEQLLWRGTDLNLYLQILTYLPLFGIPYLGRPTIPPLPDEADSSLLGSDSIEFDIWVIEPVLSMARWVRRTYEENQQQGVDGAVLMAEGKTPALGLPPWKPEDQDESLLDATFACALCNGDYATPIDKCPGCGSAIYSQRQADLIDTDLLSSLPHPDFTRALRIAMLEAGIPFNNSQIRSSDIVRTQPGIRDDIVVLNADFERAKRIMSNILRYWKFSPGLSVSANLNPLDSYWPVRADDNHWASSDLTARIWSGTSLFELGRCRALCIRMRFPTKLRLPTSPKPLCSYTPTMNGFPANSSVKSPKGFLSTKSPELDRFRISHASLIVQTLGRLQPWTLIP